MFCVLDSFHFVWDVDFHQVGVYFEPFKCQWHQEYSTFVRSLCSLTARPAVSNDAHSNQDQIGKQNRVFVYNFFVIETQYTCDEFR